MSEESQVTRVPIAALRPADSPRRNGEDASHVRLLAGSYDSLPPILVHRPTMRVIDGMHRLRAARLNGQSDIDVTYYDGDEAGAFIEAVRANVTHGLPLTLADRRAAAVRILESYPEMSDRSVGALTGLSGKTVGAARRRAGDRLPHPAYRLGRDGRRRPSRQPAEGKADAVAVRRKSTRSARVEDTRSILPALARDPALRHSERGRTLVRWLTTRSLEPAEWNELVGAVPAHWIESMVQLATANAREWERLASRLRRATRTPAAGRHRGAA